MAAVIKNQSKRIAEDLLNEIAMDNTLGEAPAVLREVARLHQENIVLKKRNIRVWSLALALGITFAIVLISALFIFPKYRYIPTRDNKTLCAVNSQSQIRVTAAELAQYAKDTVVESFTFEYVNYRATINEVANKRFTDSGRKQYLDSLQESGNLERVLKGRLIVRTMATKTPQVEQQGISSANQFWVVIVPIAIEFYANGESDPRSRQDFLAHVTIYRVEASAINQQGLAVNSLVLSPISATAK